MTGEMFQATFHLLLPQSLQEGRCHQGNPLRRRAECPVADDGIFRIGNHVAHGRQIHIEAHSEQIFTKDPAGLAGFFRVPRGTDRGHRSDARQLEVRILAHPGYASAFLIDKDPGIIAQSVQIIRESGYLFRPGNVGAEQGHTPAGILPEEVRHRVRSFRHAAFYARNERLDPHVEQLPHLLPKGQLTDFLYRIFFHSTTRRGGYFTRNLATTAQWSEALLLMTS